MERIHDATQYERCSGTLMLVIDVVVCVGAMLD